MSSTCDLDIHGIRLRIRTGSLRIRHTKEMFGLFLSKNSGEPMIEIEGCDESDLNLTLPLARHGLFGLHAGAFINKKQHGMILPGGAGSGKSTIVSSALHSGLKIIGDDIILLRRNENGIKLLPYSNQMFLKGKKEIEVYNVLHHYPRNVFSDTHPHVVVFPSITDREKSRLDLIEPRRDVFLRLIQSICWVEDKGIREKEASILNELMELPSYRLLLGKDHKERPEIALELLEEV